MPKMGYSMNEFDKLANEYIDKFGEAVPVWGIAYENDGELLEIIRKAIESGIPIEPKYSDDRTTVY